MYFKEREDYVMGTEIKTLDGWCEFSDRTGMESIYDYLTKGDIVSEDIVDNFMNMLPPRAMSYGYLRVGEPYNHVYDIDHRLRPIYMTFAKCDGQWRFSEIALLMKPLIKPIVKPHMALFFCLNFQKRSEVMNCLNEWYASK